MNRDNVCIPSAVGVAFCLLIVAVMPAVGQTPEDDIPKQLKQVGDQLKAIDEELQGLEVRIENCRTLGYDRQLQWWEARRQIERENREAIQLRQTILELRQAGKPVPDELTTRLGQIQQEQASRLAQGSLGEAAKQAWARVEENVSTVQQPYGWHLAKLNLLRDLVNRARRVRFYLQEAVRSEEGGMGDAPLPEKESRSRLARMLVKADPDQFDLGPIPGAEGHYRADHPFQVELDYLTRQTRRFAEDYYGECYFGRLEQPLLGRFDQAEALARRSEVMVQKLNELDERREALTEKVLEFLGHFDKDGKFADLGVPNRRKDLKVDSDGRPNELLFSTSTIGSPGPIMDPLCFDMADFRFYTHRFAAEGVVDFPKQWMDELTLVLDQGYFIKQPVTVLTHRNSPLIHAGFEEEHKGDPDIFLRNAQGKYCDNFNIWHPAVRKTMVTNLKAYVRYHKDFPNLLLYDKLTWEPMFVAATDPGPWRGTAFEAGYNPQAIEAFRAYLKDKFGDIDALNKAWRTEYSDFESIEPPADPFLVERRRATPLSYEFETFRIQSYTDYLKMCAEAIQEEDPDHPLAVEVQTFGQFSFASADSFHTASGIPAQYIECHDNNWTANYSELNLLYSLCFYTGKFPVESEYIWTYPRLAHPRTEEEFRVTGELSIWRKMVWGRKMLQFFGAYDGFGYRHNFMDERYCQLGLTLGPTGSVVREAGTAITIGKKRAREFWPYLNKTEVVKPKIAVLEPTTAKMNEYPYCSPFYALSPINTELLRFERILTPRDYDFRFVPEAVVVNGKEDLSGFQVIIVPYAPYFADGLAEKLLAWTRAGGTLICSGMPGIYDKYGFGNPVLPRTAFGSSLSYKYAGDDRDWRWDLTVSGGPTTILVRDGDRPVLVKAPYEKGMVLLSAEPFSSTRSQHHMQTVLFDHLQQAIGCPMAFSDRHRFEMVTREDSDGQRYLFVTNPDLNELAIDYVTVDGEYRQVIDLGISSVCEVPLVPREPMFVSGRYYSTSERSDGTSIISVVSSPGRTTFQFRLAPGEATVLKLVN